MQYELVPFVSEVYNLGAPAYYVVAVAKVEDDSTELTYLKDKYTCHSGIFTAAGWVYPLAYLLSNSWIRGYGCDSLRAAAEYFTKSCAPGARSPEYNVGKYTFKFIKRISLIHFENIFEKTINYHQFQVNPTTIYVIYVMVHVIDTVAAMPLRITMDIQVLFVV